MKQVVKVIDTNGKSFTKEFNTRDEALFRTMLLCKSKVEVPKKGKGSYKRNKRVNVREFC